MTGNLDIFEKQDTSMLDLLNSPSSFVSATYSNLQTLKPAKLGTNMTISGDLFFFFLLRIVASYTYL